MYNPVPVHLARQKYKMNEYKIQLESREDLTYLRDEMNKFLNENCEENSEKVLEAIKQQVKRLKKC